MDFLVYLTSFIYDFVVCNELHLTEEMTRKGSVLMSTVIMLNVLGYYNTYRYCSWSLVHLLIFYIYWLSGFDSFNLGW